MKRVQTAAVAVFGLRVAYGVALIAAPERMAKSWLGPVGDPAKVALRGVGGREIALHGFALGAAARGAPLLPWLLMSIAGDLGDIAATFAGRDGIPDGAAGKTAAVAGGSAALSVAVLVAERA